MEYFDVVDQKDKVIGKATRRECHSNPKLIHRAVYVLVVDKNRILLQKRSMKKDLNPGKWDLSVGGHNRIGERYEDAAKRELKEELDLTLPMKKLGKLFVPMNSQTEMIAMFIAHVSREKIKFDKDEIEEIRFFTLDEIKFLKEEQLTERFWDVMNFYLERCSF